MIGVVKSAVWIHRDQWADIAVSSSCFPKPNFLCFISRLWVEDTEVLRQLERRAREGSRNSTYEGDSNGVVQELSAIYPHPSGPQYLSS